MPGIGDSLRETRMRQKIDITEVESATKIRAKYLRALENEEWNLLPGPTFTRTFLRTYAQHLGLDAQLIVEEYRAQYEPRGESDLQQQFAPHPRGREVRTRRAPGRGLAVAAALVALLGFLLVLGLTGEEDDGGGGGTTSAREQRPAAEQPREKPEETPAARPTTVTLRVVPSEPTYVCVDRGRPPVVFAGTLERPRTFRGRRLRLNLGRTSARVTVNGRRVPVRGSDAVGFEFTPRGRKPLPLGERPCA